MFKMSLLILVFNILFLQNLKKFTNTPEYSYLFMDVSQKILFKVFSSSYFSKKWDFHFSARAQI